MKLRRKCPQMNSGLLFRGAFIKVQDLRFKQYFIMNNHNEDWAAGNLPI